MFKASKKAITAKPSGRLRLRTALIVPFVLQILAAVGLVGYLSFKTGKEAINDLAAQLQAETSARIEEKLDNYLAIPHLINKLNADAINLLELDIENVAALEQHFWHQLQSLDTVSSIGFSSSSGMTIAVRRVKKDKFHILVADNSTNGELQEYATDPRGLRTYLYSVLKNYDPRTRPWYQYGIQAEKPAIWGEAFASLLDRRFEIVATRQVADDNGNVIGLTTATLILSQMDDFLQSLEIAKSGEAFIINRKGQLIASSTEQQPFLDESGSAKTIDATNSKVPLLRLTTQHLIDRFGNLSQINRSQKLSVAIDGEEHFLQVVPFRDEFNLDWLIVVAIPRADYMESIYANTRITIGLCLTALILAIFLGLLVSQWIIKSVADLENAAISLTRGEWNKEVKKSPIEELETLGLAFNRMAKQLQKTWQKLEQKNQALEVSDRLKDELMKNISHQLRTPLNGIIGSIRIILDGFCDNKVEEIKFLQLADKSAVHLLHSIDEILDLAQIKAGKLPVKIKLVNLHECLGEAIALMRPELRRKNLELFTAEFSESILVMGDATKLKQVFLNVIENAINFTEQGSITITTEIKPGVQTYDIAQTPLAVVTIRDTGVGIEPSVQHKLFESFGTLNNSTNPIQRNCGLGLAISRGLMELMGGTITLESEGKGLGTTVAIALPISLKLANGE
ncbi:MAG: sensor histidine kinase [Cyanobacteriota bacterium]|nr:sensor histidine kinase [Cyanobacteriota bacterium]